MEKIEIDFNALQAEIHAWHLRNYPSAVSEDDLLSIGEELGELFRAQLKQDGGIRGTYEHWQEEKRKEIGDVLIGLFNFCARARTERRLDVRATTEKTSRQLLLKAASLFGSVIEAYGDRGMLQGSIHLNNWIERFFTCIVQYCVAEKLIWSECLLARWETISKRDFVVNPLTGGREKEV
jgi:NTP pyrophosphatase (non-canonical NTP hydrolase)